MKPFPMLPLWTIVWIGLLTVPTYGQPPGRPGGPPGGPSGRPPAGPNSIQISTRNGQTSVTVQMRTWTSKDGSFSIEAKLLNPESFDSKVQLQKADGTSLDVSRGDLSDGDNHYLENVISAIARHKQRSMNGPNRAGNPSFPGSGNRRGGRGSGGFPNSPSREKKSTTYNTKKLKSLSAPAFKKATEHRYGVPERLPKDFSKVNIPFDFNHDGSSLHVSSGNIAVSNDGRLAAVGMNNRLEELSKLIIFDLQTSKVVCEKDFDSNINPLAFTPDNKTIALSNRSRDVMADESILFWNLNLQSGELDYHKGWNVDDFPDTGAFLPDGRLTTIGSRRCAIYDYVNDKKLRATGSTTLGKVAGGGGYTIDQMARDTCVVDVDQGTLFILGRNEDFKLYGNVGISPDGRLLAVIRNFELRIIDLKNGRQLLAFSAMSDGMNLRPTFLTNRFLIVGEHLYDLKLQALVAKFDTNMKFEPVVSADGAVIGVVPVDEDHFQYALTCAPVFTEWANRLETYAQGPSTVIEPGATVTMNFTGVSRGITDQVKKRLESQGLRIGGGSPIVLSASVENLPRETVQVRVGGRLGDETTTVSFTPTRSEMALHVDGKVIWEKSRVNRPGSNMQGKKGEGPIGTANRLSRPNPKFFTSGVVPVNLRLFEQELPVISIGSPASARTAPQVNPFRPSG